MPTAATSLPCTGRPGCPSGARSASTWTPTIVRARERALGLTEREGEFQGPIAIEVDDDGRVFVLEAPRHRVQIFSKQTAMFAGEL